MTNYGTYLLVVSLLLCVAVPVMAVFNEVPASQVVPVGSEAVFTCQHPTADIIRWRVNETLVSTRNPPPDITLGTTRDEEGNLVDTLTIVARLEYSGTVVECVAEFDDGTPDERSEPPAMLWLVQGIQMTSPIPITTTTTTVVREFTLFPTSKNVALDTVAVFQCRHPTARVIDWIINGTLVQQSSPGISLTTSGDTSTLSITAQSQFNSTEIQCEAFFSDAPSQTSDTAIMMIQGLLNNVTNLVRVNSTTISWEPPFSLDLTDVDPDIVYCVEVYNVTDCEKGELLTGDCNVTVTNYTIPNDIGSELSDMIYMYEYIVTPRSSVSGSVNGTASWPVRNHPLVFTIDQETLKPKSNTTTSYITELSFHENDLPVPSNYTLFLEPVDGVGNGKSLKMIANTTLNEPHRVVSLSVPQLNRERVWRCSILAYGCSDHSLVLQGQPEVYLSTHDIQGVHVNSPQPGELSVDGYFIEDSTASGVLVIATDGGDTSYHFIDRDSDRLNGDTRVSGLPGGEYIVSVFVMKESGLPVKRAAAIPMHHQHVANKSTTEPSSLIDYSVQSTSIGVCINCTFLESSTTTDCVAVVHQRISQLNSSAGLMNIESSHKLNRSGDTASGCIEGVNLEDYQVGVVGVRINPGTNTDPTNTSPSIFGGVVVSVVIVVLLAVVVIVLLVIVVWNWKSPKSHTQKDGPAPPNPYEPASPTNNPSVSLVNRVPSDGGNCDTVINMAGSPPPPPHTAGCPPQYSTLFHPGTASKLAGVGVNNQVNEAMYLTPAEVSGTINKPVTTDEQVNHPDIKHEEINGDQYAVVSKPKKESKSSEDSEGDKKPLVYSTLADVASSVKAPPTTDDPVAYSSVQHEKGENGEQQAVVDKQESGVDDSVGEAIKDNKGAVIYSTPELKHQVGHMPLDDDRVEYAVVKEPKGQTLSTEVEEVSHHDKVSLPGQTLLTPKPAHPCIASNNDSGIGHSDSDSRSSAPPCSSGDKESVQQSGTESEPVVSTPVQQQTVDFEQGPAVHQASDDSTRAQWVNTYENAHPNYFGDKQGMYVDPVRTGDTKVFQVDVGMVPVVYHFQSDAFDSSSYESVADELARPELPSEQEQTEYMLEMLSRYNSISLNLSQSERVRLLYHRCLRSNYESDELWQSQAKNYGMWSESGNLEVQKSSLLANMKQETHKVMLQSKPWFIDFNNPNGEPSVSPNC